MALTDQLTQLRNRHFLVEAAAAAVAASHRDRDPLSLIVLDIDRFKTINDSHGHRAGDLVLIEVAAVLRQHCGSEDIAARLGGEEFVMLLPHCEIGAAAARAELLRARIESLTPAGISVTASFGVANTLHQANPTFDTLFGRADKALYAAKHGGRNRVVCTVE